MKKIIALVLIACGTSFAADIFRDVALTSVSNGTLTSVASLTITENQVVYPAALFQKVGGGTTNTVALSIAPYGQTNEYSVGSLAAITNANSLQTFGFGDKSTTVDDIWLTKGDVFYVRGTGTASSNVIYKLRLKQVNQ